MIPGGSGAFAPSCIGDAPSDGVVSVSGYA